MSNNNKTVAVAIDRDKGSQSALKWAVDNLLCRGQTVYLVHVKVKQSASFSAPLLLTPKPSKSSGLSESFSGDTDSHLRELFLPFRCFCTRKDIQTQEVVLEDADVVKALIEFATQSVVDILVVGAPSKSGLLKKFKIKDIPGSVSRGAPDFCTIHVISKGKVASTKAASRPPPFISPLRSLPPQEASGRFSDASADKHLPIVSKGIPRKPTESSLPKPPMESSLPRPHTESFDSFSSSPNDTNAMKSPFTHRKGPNGKSYGEISQPEADVSHVSSGRQSIDNLFSSFDSFEMPSSTPRVSFTELDNQSFDSNQFGHKSPEVSHTSFESPRTSTSSNMEDIEAEMRRLKLELKHTMEMYNTACKEAVNAKHKAMALQQWKLEEQQKIEEARTAEEAAFSIVEMEKAKSKAAIEAAEAAQRIAELESQKRKKAEMKALKEAEEKNKVLSSLSQSDARYRKYTIEEIEIATEYFSESRKIGEGGYGPVYKCYLDHTPVAVKVLRPDASQGRSQFQQEVEVLSCIRHPHMVLLLGACPEYGCLVYEYMSNGSLEDCLLRKNNPRPLSWQHRFRIAAEIGSGLLFLHQTKPEPLVHRDLKPANILLDRNFVSKIADVGLARLVPPSVADTVTQYHMTSAAGTFCYIDPEYQQTGMLGVKSDVYSLGIMFLQIITARPPMGLTHHVERAIEAGNFAAMLDPAVVDWPVEEALSFAKLCLQCAELRRKDRPDLGKVVMPELERLRSIAEESMYGSNPSGSYGQVSPDNMSYPEASQSGYGSSYTST